MVVAKIGQRWALVSKSNPNKVLKWFGPIRPTPDEVEAEEKRVNYFKHNIGEKIKTQERVSVRAHRTSDGRYVPAHFRKKPKRTNRTTRRPNWK